MATIHRLNPGDAAAAARWDAFVLGCPAATFFHRAAWQQVMHEPSTLPAAVTGVPRRIARACAVWRSRVSGSRQAVS